MMRKGFTLIELLIVVAIIAILAAIAVPNFLEAQTRARVATVLSDMRAVNVAIESYVIDRNTRPSAYYPGREPTCKQKQTWGKWFLRAETFGGTFSGIGGQLTSPIAYMTDLPLDQFNTDYILKYSKSWGGLANASMFYAVDRCKTHNFGIPNDAGQSGQFIWIYDIGYFLQSGGPNLVIWSHDTGFIYDPTNGTVSPGDIYYVGHGMGFLGAGQVFNKGRIR